MTETTTQTEQALTSTPGEPEAETRPLRDPEPAKNGYWWGTGRRKSSIARVRIRPAEGDSTFTVNGKPMNEFFTEPQHVGQLEAPLKDANMNGNMQVFVKVRGGGYTGQAGAILLGLARALKKYDPRLEHDLRDAGYLTRDAREVERKKYGQSGARRKFQFSKR